MVDPVHVSRGRLDVMGGIANRRSLVLQMPSPRRVVALRRTPTDPGENAYHHRRLPRPRGRRPRRRLPDRLDAAPPRARRRRRRSRDRGRRRPSRGCRRPSSGARDVAIPRLGVGAERRGARATSSTAAARAAPPATRARGRARRIAPTKRSSDERSPSRRPKSGCLSRLAARARGRVPPASVIVEVAAACAALAAFTIVPPPDDDRFSRDASRCSANAPRTSSPVRRAASWIRWRAASSHERPGLAILCRPIGRNRGFRAVLAPDTPCGALNTGPPSPASARARARRSRGDVHARDA